jgi:prepilin-type N-terminal cleavage/methylation domain-containing protein
MFFLLGKNFTYPKVGKTFLPNPFTRLKNEHLNVKVQVSILVYTYLKVKHIYKVFSLLAIFLIIFNNEDMFNTKKLGFTLIELIIVVGIIGLLSAIGIGSYSNVSRNARNEKRKADLRELKQAIEYYYSQNGAYPDSGSAWRGPLGSAWYSASYPDLMLPSLVTGGYISSFPTDPKFNKINGGSANAGCRTTANQNSYIYLSNGVEYKLLAHCTPEGTLVATDTYYDPARPNYAWAVYSPGARLW